MTITKFELCKSGWHVATVNHDDGGGAIFHPVVAWGLTDGGAVVPLVPGDNAGPTELVEVSSFDEEDVLGLVSPGDESNPCWDDEANGRLEAEREVYRNREDHEHAEKIAGKMGPEEYSFLHRVNASSPTVYGGVRYSHENSLLLSMLEHGLIEQHFTSTSDRAERKPSYHCTRLGRNVLGILQDRVKVEAVEPEPEPLPMLEELPPPSSSPTPPDSGLPPDSGPPDDDDIPAF